MRHACGGNRNFTDLAPSFSRFGNAGKQDAYRKVTRTGYETIQYEWTLVDPSTFTDRITATVPMTKVAGQLYEYGCHEGNYGMTNLLRGERMAELRATAGSDADGGQ